MAGVAGLPQVNNINKCDTKSGQNYPAESAGNPSDCRTFQVPRTLLELRSFLHGYRIRAAGDEAKIARTSDIIRHIDDGKTSLPIHRAARELADLDPFLSWLPAWKPRVAVAAKGEA